MENLREIKKEELLKEVTGYMEKKWRFVVIVCSDMGEKFEVTYFFNKSPGMYMEAIRMFVDKHEEVPSISKVYITAIINENEIKELFGIKITDIAIDFGGYMLLSQDSPEFPMLKHKTPVEKGSE